jgi:hypothetical protein
MITYKCGDINLRGMRLRDYIQMWWYKLKGRKITLLLTNVVL